MSEKNYKVFWRGFSGGIDSIASNFSSYSYNHDRGEDEHHDVQRIKDMIDEVLFADYTYEDYNGDAIVIYRGKDGKLYEQTGGHCSCNGLEEQWTFDPKPISVKYLREMRKFETKSEYSWDRKPADVVKAWKAMVASLPEEI